MNGKKNSGSNQHLHQGHRAAHRQPTPMFALDPATAIRKRKLEYLRHHHPQIRTFLPASESVDRDGFLRKFDSLGVLLDRSEPGANDRVVILYSDTSAYPEPETILASNSSYFDDADEPKRPPGVLLSVEDATKNCNNLHVVLVGQYESFHVHKFMRVSEEPDPKFRSKSRFKADPYLRMKTNGGRSVTIPTVNDFRANWRALGSYLGSLEAALAKLEPVTRAVASGNPHNAVVVMVCNFGRSELLANLVCHARPKGLGKALGSVLVFATLGPCPGRPRGSARTRPSGP